MGNRSLVAAVPTVFHDDGTLDRDGLIALAATYVAAGCATLIVLEPSGGEADSLDPDERDLVVRAAREGAAGIPVVVGIGAAGPDAVARAHRAGSAGADGLSVTLPAERGGVSERLDEVAGTGLPMWLHHPATAGPRDGTAATLRFAEDAAAAAVVVEVTPTPDAIAEVSAAGRRAYGGLGGLFLPEELDAGATGTIAASAVPERLQEVLGEVPDEGPMALDAYLAVLPYLRLEIGSPGLRVRKEAWRQRGVITSARTRRGTPLGTTTKQAITRRLREVGIAPRDGYPGA